MQSCGRNTKSGGQAPALRQPKGRDAECFQRSENPQYRHSHARAPSRGSAETLRMQSCGRNTKSGGQAPAVRLSRGRDAECLQRSENLQYRHSRARAPSHGSPESFRIQSSGRNTKSGGQAPALRQPRGRDAECFQRSENPQYRHSRARAPSRGSAESLRMQSCGRNTKSGGQAPALQGSNAL